MKKDRIRHRNNQLEIDLKELREKLGADKIKQLLTNPEIYQLGFYCYKRGLLHRGQEVLREEDDERIFSAE